MAVPLPIAPMAKPTLAMRWLQAVCPFITASVVSLCSPPVPWRVSCGADTGQWPPSWSGRVLPCWWPSDCCGGGSPRHPVTNGRKMLPRFGGATPIRRVPLLSGLPRGAPAARIRLHGHPLFSILPAVSLAIRLMALLLAALWLPQTMHCQLARLGFTSEPSSCCDEHSCSNSSCDCQSDVCKSIEAGHYDLSKGSISVPLEAQVWIKTSGTADWWPDLKPAASSPVTTGDPPELPRIWQFVFRAAPSPRAPSIAC